MTPETRLEGLRDSLKKALELKAARSVELETTTRKKTRTKLVESISGLDKLVKKATQQAKIEARFDEDGRGNLGKLK